MREMETLEVVEDAHANLIERVSSYYARYVDTMWSVVVLHSKSAVGDELWPVYMSEFETMYMDHSSFERELCGIITREDGLDARVALDELHEDLEYQFHVELLAQHGMTVLAARRLEYLSRIRLARHAALRKHVRYCIDTAQFHTGDAVTRLERQLSRAHVAAKGSLAVMSCMYPRVIPL